MKVNKRKKGNNGGFQILFIVLVTLIAFLAMSIVFFKENFEGVEFSTIFVSLITPLEGGRNTFKEWIEEIIPVTGTCFFIATFLAFVQKKTVLKITIRRPKKERVWNIWLSIYKRRKMLSVFGVIIIVFELMLGIKTVGMIEFFLAKGDYSTVYEEYYINPTDVKLDFPEEKRNLILIYMEAMDTALADLTLATGKTNLIPELEKIATENISFSNTDKLGGGYSCYGTTWTMGGLLAGTLGVPYDVPIGENNMEFADKFLPGLTTMGDILDEQGYRQMFMCGSVGTFGGRELYFTQHGKYEIVDFNYARNQGWVEKGNDFWGIEDEKLYEFAKSEIIRLADSAEPFNFTLLTVDTHFVEGYVCTKCEDDFEEQYANVYRCASKQVNEFLEWIQQQEFYKNTTVILLGDHNCMNYGFTDSADRETIRTYNAFINSAKTPSNISERQFTTMDYFPTILSSIGVEIEGNRLGLGTNLFSQEKTIPEKIGMSVFENELKKNSKFYMSFYFEH